MEYCFFFKAINLLQISDHKYTFLINGVLRGKSQESLKITKNRVSFKQ